MAEEIENKPNDPNSSTNTNTESNVSNQVEVANELNSVLEQVSDRLEKIKKITKSQSDMMLAMTQSFQNMNTHVNSMSQSSQTITESVTEAAETVFESIDSQSIERISESLEKVGESASQGLTSNSQSLTELGQSVTDVAGTYGSVSESLGDISESLGSDLDTLSSDILLFRENVKDLADESKTFSEKMVELGKSIKDIGSSIYTSFKNVFTGAFALVKTVVNTLGSLVGAATQFVKFSLSIPFTIAQEAVKLGNMIRTDLVEIIQQSAEDLKESFDFDSRIGEGIQKMTARGKGMLLAFQSPSNELVKLFGMGANGIANMIKEVGTNVAAMGHFSELFGRSIMGNAKNLKDFTRMTRAFGFSSEDIHYMALDAATNMQHINVRMAKMGQVLSSVSEEFGVDRKRLAKNFMIMRKNIIQFAHLSDEEIASTTARLTQMRVKLEDAVAVFDKFKTFEDAANSVAMLSQTFGMNLDAFDMIQARNPEEIINMFRDSMLATGRSFADLNRFEKDLMAQHTGMSAESLSALMHYRDLGLTHQEAVDKMASERPEAKQMKALKELNSAIKEIQKILTFDSPFKAFADGLANNVTLSGELKNVMVSLSQGYEGIYNYARTLDAKTWSGLVKPINYIINIMKGIFESKAFKTGLVKTVEVISRFIGQIFNFEQPIQELNKTSKMASNAGREVANGLSQVADLNSQNTNYLVTLSGKIMGSIIKGAAIGFTALLMSVNDGIDLLNDSMSRQDPYKNVIETFFGWNPGDVNAMGSSLGDAVSEFFSKSDGMISLTGWLIEGLTDIADIAVGIFGGAIAKSIDKIFGTKFAERPENVFQQASIKSQRQSLPDASKSVMSSLDTQENAYEEAEKPIDKNSLASMLHSLKEKAEGVKDEKVKNALLNKFESLKQSFLSGGTNTQYTTLGFETSALLQGIQGDEYIGGDINEVADTSRLGVKTSARLGPQYNWIMKLKRSAQEFDKIVDQKNPNKNYKDLLDGYTLGGSTFMNLEEGWNSRMRIFWNHYHKQILKNLKASKTSWLDESTNDNFLKSKYYREFKKIITGQDGTLTLNTTKQSVDPMLKPKGVAPEYTQASANSVRVSDLSFFNKFVNVSESKNILDNLLDSVNLPVMDESSAIATMDTMNNQQVTMTSQNSSNKLTKQQIIEQTQKLEKIKKQLQEENKNVDTNIVFDKDVIDKLMKLMAKNNLVRILGMPEYTNGVMSLTESALGSRCFNIGSDGTAPSIETIQPSGS